MCRHPARDRCPLPAARCLLTVAASIRARAGELAGAANGTARADSVLWTSAPFAVRLPDNSTALALLQQHVLSAKDGSLIFSRHSGISYGLMYHLASDHGARQPSLVIGRIASELLKWADFLWMVLQHPWSKRRRWRKRCCWPPLLLAAAAAGRCCCPLTASVSDRNGQAGHVLDLQFLAAPNGALYLVDPMGFSAVRPRDALQGIAGHGLRGAATSSDPPHAHGTPARQWRVQSYLMRRQRVELLSLALSASLLAIGRVDIVDAMLCQHAICDLECLFLRTPPIARAALSTPLPPEGTAARTRRLQAERQQRQWPFHSSQRQPQGHAVAAAARAVGLQAALELDATAASTSSEMPPAHAAQCNPCGLRTSRSARAHGVEPTSGDSSCLTKSESAFAYEEAMRCHMRVPRGGQRAASGSERCERSLALCYKSVGCSWTLNHSARASMRVPG